jgi:hypothetical protein
MLQFLQIFREDPLDIFFVGELVAICKEIEDSFTATDCLETDFSVEQVALVREPDVPDDRQLI